MDDDGSDRFKQTRVSGINGLEKLLEQGEEASNNDPAKIELNDAKRVVRNTYGSVDVRYHHDKGLSREDLEDTSLDLDPDLGIDTARLNPGTAVMILDVACRYDGMLDSERPRRKLDYICMANDYFENGRELIEGSPPEGSGTELDFHVQDRELQHYTIEVIHESSTRVMHGDGTSSPAYEGLLVMEGSIEP